MIASRRLWLLSALCALTLWMGAGAARAQTPICESAGVQVSVDFTSGGRHTCRVTDSGEIILDVTPEGTPINSSPWFAFRLDAAERARLRLTLDYGQYEHRYPPKLSRDAVNWRYIRQRDVVVADDRHSARIHLDVDAGMTVIAAQPIETPNAVHDWARAALAPHAFEQVQYGSSVDGRPLIAYRGGEGTDLIVAMTRQHPPELSGSVAFRAFVERIMSDAPQAQAFRARHRILLAPMPNPDGVARGHWRWNNGGVDLNRDWRRFRQPETRALRDLIIGEAENRRTIAFLDFHSTLRNVVYAPPLDADSPTVDFLPLLRERLDRAVDRPLPWTYSHSATGNNSKRWALEALSAPGLTVELDDEATWDQAQRIGYTVADALMDYADGVRAP